MFAWNEWQQMRAVAEPYITKFAHISEDHEIISAAFERAKAIDNEEQWNRFVARVEEVCVPLMRIAVREMAKFETN